MKVYKDSKYCTIGLLFIIYFVTNLTIFAGPKPIEEAREELQKNYTNITDQIEDLYLFSEGATGYYISDGGNDMYDNGNFIQTNLGGYINYTNNQVSSSNYFGENATYFTAKYPGLFVLVADNININSLYISGYLGTGGSGNVDETVIETSNFTGYVKRVYMANDPSVNHMIIIKKDSNVVHSISSSSYYDTDNMDNLSNTNRIYYLLFSKENGQYADNQTMKNVMGTFLKYVEILDTINPQPVSNLNISKIQNNKIEMTFIAPSDDSTSEKVFAYEIRIDTLKITDANINSAPVFNNTYKPAEPGDADTISIPGLLSNKKYWISIRSLDESDNVSIPVIKEFTTKADPEIQLSGSDLSFEISIGDTFSTTLGITNTGPTNASDLEFNLSAKSSISFGNRIFVADYYNNLLSEVNMADNSEKIIPLNIRPALMKSVNSNQTIWIYDNNNSKLNVIDAKDGSVLLNKSLSNIFDILISEDETKAFVFTSNSNINVTVYDTKTLTIIKTFSLDIYNSGDILLSSDASKIYVLYDYTFYIIDANTGSRISYINLNHYVYRIAKQHGSDLIYAYRGNSYISMISPEQNVYSEVYIGHSVNNLLIASDGRVFIQTDGYNYIDVYNADLSSSISYTIKPSYINDIKLSRDGKYLFMINGNAYEVLVYDTEYFSLKNTYTPSLSNLTSLELMNLSADFIKFIPSNGYVEVGNTVNVGMSIESDRFVPGTYNFDINLKNNSSNSPEVTIPMTIVAKDTKGPDFNIVFIQNPYITSDLNLIVFAHEKLDNIPTLSANTDSTNLELIVQDSTYYMYSSKYKLTGTEDVEFTVSGVDSINNYSQFSKTISITKIDMEPAVASFSNDFQVYFPSNSFSGKTYVTIWKEELSNSISNSGSESYHVGPVELLSDNDILVKSKYTAVSSNGFDPRHLSLFMKDENNNWTAVPSNVDENNKTIQAGVRKLGEFKIGYDENIISETIENSPESYSLMQNFPNPFNPTTKISYSLTQKSYTSLKVFDLLGREVCTLVNSEQKAGKYTVNFDAENLATGIYIYELRSGNFVQAKKMLLIK